MRDSYQRFFKKFNINVNDLVEFIISLSEFTVDETEIGYMIYNDWPYINYFDPIDHLSTTIVKLKGQDRPSVISFTLAPIVDIKMGLSILKVILIMIN